VRSVDSE